MISVPDDKPSALKVRSLSCALLLMLISVSGIFAGAVSGQEIDLSNAAVVVPDDLTARENKAVTVLIEEIEKRTRIRLPRVSKFPASGATITVVSESSLKAFAGNLVSQMPADMTNKKPEGYRIGIANGKNVVIAGNDERGELFGVGRLLRNLRLGRDSIKLPADLKISTAPETLLRGHQLGFRPKTNSYDAFTIQMWEQYIRDLAIFGTNAIELIPPRSDDDEDSPHFPETQIKMMAAMSKVIDEYGLDCWIWYPAMDKDYGDPATVDLALKEWDEVLKQLPRIDAIMVPGGDPGHTHPKNLMPMLEKQAAQLEKHHKGVKWYVAPQGFNVDWMNEFYAIMKTQPKWLTGVVHGPQVRDSLAKLKASIPPQYTIRNYPDITHSFSAQYAVPQWDLAYPQTEAREVINPRPTDERKIFDATNRYTFGFLTYSEGVNDDVNKFVWSSLGWDSKVDLRSALRDYSRYFIANEMTDDFAEGLFGLERDWQGPLASNANVDDTLARFRQMERRASPQVLANWRFQQALYRAYYDGYVKSRLLQETVAQEKANEYLRDARRLGSLTALQMAEAVLDKTVADNPAEAYRGRVLELAEALYQSIRMQLATVKYYGQPGRGSNIDTLDAPLNDRNWLKVKFNEIRALTDEKARIAAIDAVVNWTDAGPGGFYDDLGNASRQPHLQNINDFAKDPGAMESAFSGFAAKPDWRRSWMDTGETAFDTPLEMLYTGLDPNAQYKVRVVYGGTTPDLKINLTANKTFPVHGFIAKPNPVVPLEFDIPAAATASGELRLAWDIEPGRRGNGRGRQVSEVWLIKK